MIEQTPGAPSVDAVIVGAPRSGTTWLQRLLACHDEIASPQETHLFDKYLAPLAAAWSRERQLLDSASRRQASKRASRLIGLPAILSDDDMDWLSRALLYRLRERVLSQKPSARLVVEKTPSNSLHVHLINRLVPDVLFIHMIRDPRDVVASMLMASEGWGARWAPSRAGWAARVWRRHYLGASEARRYRDRYIELRYDRLQADPAGELRGVLDRLGVTTTLEEAAAVVKREQQSAGTLDVFAMDRRWRGPRDRSREPVNFNGSSSSPARRRLSRFELVEVEDVVGGELEQLGLPRQADGTALDRLAATTFRRRTAAANALRSAARRHPR
jgi:LPS sulfotransferase NodH